MYHFYYPIYNLRKPSNNIKLGYSTIVTFDSLPSEIKESFILFWENYFTISTEYARTEKEYVDRKKTSTFLHLKVEAKDDNEAIEKASNLVKDSVSILSFLYWWAYFPIHHCFYVSEGSEYVGGAGDYYYISGLYISEYRSKYEKEISKLTDILIKPMSEIDRKIRNTLIIFGIQSSVTNEQARFVLLTTCLESLLMTKSDRDYLRWRLAEKAAFLFAKNKRMANRNIKLGYDKRSAFIHGSSGKNITQNDVNMMLGTVISVLRRLVELKETGFNKMEDIDEFVEKLKFGEY